MPFAAGQRLTQLSRELRLPWAPVFSLMQLHTQTAASLLVVVGLVGGSLCFIGCSSTSTGQSSLSRSPNKAEVTRRKAKVSGKSAEQRVEAHARYAHAILLDLKEDSEEAAEEYYKAGLADLASESLVLEASGRLLRLKMNDKAIELLTRATKHPGASSDIFVRLAAAYTLAGKTNEAISASQTAIRKNPRSLAPYRQLAQVYLHNRSFASGLKVLDQAAAVRNPDATFLVDLAELVMGYARAGATNGAQTRALELLNRAASQNPANPMLMQRLAEGFEMLGDTQKAIEFTLKLRERFPALPGWREKLVDLYLGQEDTAKAAELLHQMIRDAPTDPRPYLSLGKIAMHEQKPQQAVEHFEKVLLLKPDFEQAYYELAIAQMTTDQGYSALSTLERARTRYPKSFAVEFYTGLAYARLKDYSGAIRHLIAAEVIAAATASNRLNHTFYFQLGSAYERNGQREEAVRYFRKSLELHPDFSEALNYLGYMWAERGENLDEAKEFIEKAVKLEPKNAAYLDSLGWVFFKMNKPREALTWLLKAVENLEEPDPTIYDHLGDVYIALNQNDKARDAWQKALSIEPNDIKQQVQKKLGAVSTPGRGGR